jgi:hypothetical protein
MPCPDNILSRKPENVPAFPAIVFNHDAAEINSDGAAKSFGLRRRRMSLCGALAGGHDVLSDIHLVTLNILALQVGLHYRASSRYFVELGRSYWCHGPGLAIHVQRNLQAKQIEQCRSDIRDGMLVTRDLPVGKEHAGNETGVYAVIPTPSFGINFENRRRHLALC